MPKFTIEMTFDVPHYRQTVYEAETVEEAIAMARADDDWESQTKDYDTSGAERITGIWPGEEAYFGVGLPIPKEDDTATAARLPIDMEAKTGTTLPWRVVPARSYVHNSRTADIVDGNGIYVARSIVQEHAEAIVQAVNERHTAAGSGE